MKWSEYIVCHKLDTAIHTIKVNGTSHMSFTYTQLFRHIFETFMFYRFYNRLVPYHYISIWKWVTITRFCFKLDTHWIYIYLLGAHHYLWKGDGKEMMHFLSASTVFPQIVFTPHLTSRFSFTTCPPASNKLTCILDLPIHVVMIKSVILIALILDLETTVDIFVTYRTRKCT